MTGTFITDIHIKKVRHISNFQIPIPGDKLKHLILTGRNGSGKTSVLEVIRDYIQEYTCRLLLCDGSIKADGTYRLDGSKINPDPPVEKIKITCNADIKTLYDHIFLYFPAHHKLVVDEPQHIEKTDPTGSRDFLKYLFDLDYQKLGAESDNNIDEEKRISKWFENLNYTLQDIYECTELELKIDRKDKKAQIIIPNRNPFSLNEMADGYASLLDIVIELMINMDKKANGSYDMPGIVLVDEIETHLHVDLQKKVLRFLTKMFPNIQFIVTTHSPFVISSLENAVVCDLEQRKVLTDLSAYSYDGIIEYYYGADKYSGKIKTDFETYKSLINKEKRTKEENRRLTELIACLGNIPSAAAPELVCAFRELEQKRKARNGKN